MNGKLSRMQTLIKCQELSGEADQIALLAYQLKEKTAEIQALTEAMEDVWKGDAEKLLQMQLTEQLSKEAALEQQFLALASFLKTAADVWQEADRKWAEEITSI